MLLTLIRNDYREDGIFGLLHNENGEVLATTLEHAFASGDSYVPKLPLGSYLCQRGIHSLHSNPKLETFEVTKVPGHTGILFHVGNFNKDSDGCILLGHELYIRAKEGYMITGSQQTFANFIKRLKGVNQFNLTVEDI